MSVQLQCEFSYSKLLWSIHIGRVYSADSKQYSIHCHLVRAFGINNYSILKLSNQSII